jgi:hypothetical protein
VGFDKLVRDIPRSAMEHKREPLSFRGFHLTGKVRIAGQGFKAEDEIAFCTITPSCG